MNKKDNADPWFSETERLIYRYWHDLDRLKKLKAREQILRDQIETLDKDLCQLIHIRDFPFTYGAVHFKARSGDQDYADRLQRQEEQIDLISDILVKKFKKLGLVRHRIFQHEEFIASLRITMEKLSPEELKLTERRYVYGDSNYQIGNILHCSEHRVRNMRNRIIKLVAVWLRKKNGRDTGAPDHKNHDKLIS